MEMCEPRDVPIIPATAETKEWNRGQWLQAIKDADGDLWISYVNSDKTLIHDLRVQVGKAPFGCSFGVEDQVEFGKAATDHCKRMFEKDLAKVLFIKNHGGGDTHD